MGINSKPSIGKALPICMVFVLLAKIIFASILMAMEGRPVATPEKLAFLNSCVNLGVVFILAVWFFVVLLYRARVAHHGLIDFITALVVFASGLSFLVSSAYAIYYYRIANDMIRLQPLEVANWAYITSKPFLWFGMCGLFISIYQYRKALWHNNKIRSNIYFLYVLMILEVAALVFAVKTSAEAGKLSMLAYLSELIAWILFSLFLFKYMKSDFKLREHRHHHHSRGKYEYLQIKEVKAEVNPELGKYESHEDYVRMKVEDVEPQMNPALGTYEEHHHHHHHKHEKK